MILLDKLEVYSNNLYRNLSLKNKNQLVCQIEYFLNEGVTPLKIILWIETKTLTLLSKSNGFWKEIISKTNWINHKAQK